MSGSRELSKRAAIVAALLGLGCDAEADADACQQAKDRVQECFGTQLESCEASQVELVNSAGSCDELAAAGKADCPSWLSWLCGGDEPEFDCPNAGERADYHNFDADERMNYHWELVQCTEYGEGDNPEFDDGGLAFLLDVSDAAISSLRRFRLGRAFTNSTDELDAGRTKLFHTWGTVAKVEYRSVVGDPDAACHEDYTGIFAQGRVEGIARFSMGSNPDIIGYLPGLAIKFFIEGENSANYLAFSGLAGDFDKPNFFEQELSNVGDRSNEPLGIAARTLKFWVRHPDVLGLTRISSLEPDGTVVDRPNAPYEIIFRGTEEALRRYDETPKDDDFRVRLADAIPAGTEIYEVYAVEEAGSCEQRIGGLFTTTRFVSSVWGDEHLYFRHSPENQSPIIDGKLGN